MRRILLLPALFALLWAGPAIADGTTLGNNILTNSSFESQAGIGLPDHWTASGTAVVEGDRGTVVFGSGDARLVQELDLTNLRNRKLRVLVEAAGRECQLNVHLEGNYRASDERYRIDLLREVSPDTEWKPFSRLFKLETKRDIETARLVFSKTGPGTLRLRNPRLVLDGLTAAQTLELVHERRELRYTLRQLNAAPLPEDEKARLRATLESAIEAASHHTRESHQQLPRWRAERLNAQEAMMNASAKGQPVLISHAYPFVRLEPDLHLPAAAPQWNIPPTVALQGVETPVSFIITNPGRDGRNWQCRILLDGKPLDTPLRRQVFVESWYGKGDYRLADILPRVPSPKPGWHNLTFEGFESIQYYLDLPPLPAGKHQLEVLLYNGEGGSEAARWKREIEILPGQWKPENAARFDYFAFLYFHSPLFSHSPREAIASLEAMGTTAFEWTAMPTPKIAQDGSVESLNFANVDPWLKRVAPTSLRLGLYWGPQTKRWTLPDGTAIAQYSPEWLRIYLKITEEFLQRAEQQFGIGRERILLFLADEPHSKNYQESPDRNVQNAVAVMEAFRAAFPGVPVFTTLTDYAQYNDVVAVTPASDILAPLWRYSDRVLKYSPPNLNARTDFFERILPYLKNAQKNEGKQIWSYFIMSGTQSGVTPYYLAYPVLAVHMGLTGAGHWAYSASSGSSWDETDGPRLDYQLVYDGRERHPLNDRWNPEKEAVVPSIRWFALREGLRDARIYRTLNERIPRLPGNTPLRQRFEALQQAIGRLAGSNGYGLVMEPKITDRAFINADPSELEWWRLRCELQRLYSDLVTETGSNL